MSGGDRPQPSTETRETKPTGLLPNETLLRAAGHRLRLGKGGKGHHQPGSQNP